MSEDADIRALGRVGSVLDDKWTLERLLGVGGMAAVYAGRHRNGARAALKVLHAHLSRVEDVRERFRREGYAANSVEHEGAVKVLDDDVIVMGPDAGTAYLVMELLDGESLQDRLYRAPAVGEREFLTIAERVLEVLEAAHARGVVHRDLKPENLFLMGDIADRNAGTARVKVLDFGLARLQGQAITSYGLALGTPSFMSPEQAAGHTDEVDGRTDLFALAATGFRLRTGRRIHEGTNAVELVTKMANVAAPGVRTLAPNASEPFVRVVDRALQFRREDRYESAAAMRADVLRAIEELDPAVTDTLVAVQPGGPSVSSSEATIKVDRAPNDVPQSPRDGSSVLPAALPTDEKGNRSAPSIARSLHRPRHRSILPWLAVLVLGGVGVESWLDSRKTTGASQHSDPSLPSAISSAFANDPAPSAAPVRDDIVDLDLDAAAVAMPASSADPPPSIVAPSASVVNRPSPRKIAPVHTHKRPHNRHAK